MYLIYLGKMKQIMNKYTIIKHVTDLNKTGYC